MATEADDMLRSLLSKFTAFKPRHSLYRHAKHECEAMPEAQDSRLRMSNL